MVDYHQPDFFKFGHDSLELVDFISKYLGAEDRNILEIGTGCGVISIELALKHPTLLIDALEPQEEFNPYIKENLRLFGTNRVKLIQTRLEDFKTNQHYDVILSNPPYFWIDESRASRHRCRDICRRMNKEDFNNWLQIMSQLLKSKGKVALSYRSPLVESMVESSHDWSVESKSKGSGCSFLCFRKV